MKLVDTHCHLDLYPDYQSVIDEAEKFQILTIAVTNTPSVFGKTARLLEGKKFLRPALGLHPQLAVQRKSEFSLFQKLLTQTRYVGEVGLDFSNNDGNEQAIQKQIFENILKECALYGNKVLTIHSRRSASEVVSMIGSNFPATVILHWYSGNLQVLDRALKQGFYFSVNSSMLMSESGRRILKALPKEKVLTETDGPFITLKGLPVRPSTVNQIVVEIAKFWELDTQTTSQIIYNNFLQAISFVKK